MANLRHKRDANARSIPTPVLIAAPIATLATIGAVGLGVIASEPTTQQVAVGSSLANVPQRDQEVSRSANRAAALAEEKRQEKLILGEQTAYEKRMAKLAAERREKARLAAIAAEREATREAVANADTKLWTTEVLNLWTLSSSDAVEVGEIDAGEQVLVTGRDRDGRTEIVLDGESRWVTSGYLAEEEPAPTALGGVCTNGTSLSPGVAANLVKVHDAVCAAFPEISTYGDFRGDGEHAQGIAVDIMVSGDLGWQVAEFLKANYAELGINYLIYSQQIWSVERSGEGWRGMEDRGSVTANHYDHVHVTVY